jgi:tetratricopeptide (TPR) repeat protein
MLRDRRFAASHWLVLAAAALFPGLTACNLPARFQNIRGRQAYECGQYNEAVCRFQNALARNPIDSNAMYNLGATYHQVGKQSRNSQLLTCAEQYYRQAIAADPRYSDAHRGLAVLLAETGRRDAAFDLLQTWQQRNPFSAEPLVVLARLHHEFGDRPQSRQLLADALVRDSQNPRALTAMAYQRELDGQYDLALQNYYRAYQATGQPMIADRIAQLQSRVPAQPTAVPPPPRWGQVNPYVPR